MAVHVVPTQDLSFSWSVGHSNYNKIKETGSEYEFYKNRRRARWFQQQPWFKKVLPVIYRGKMPYPTLSKLSPETTDALVSMVGTEQDYSARKLGIKATALELFRDDTTLEEEAIKARMQQGYQAGLNLSTLLQRATDQQGLPESYVSPEEAIIVTALDEVFGQVEQEKARNNNIKGKLKKLSQRVIF